MINNKLIAVVVPAYNEELQIEMVIKTMPDFVDRVIVVNDGSKDNTEKIVIDMIQSGTVGKRNICKQADKPSEAKEDTIYNRADTVLAEMRKKEERLYPIHKVFEEDLDNRLVLISEKNNGVGTAIAIGYKWCRSHHIDCTAVMAGDGQMDPAELMSIVQPICENNVDYVKGNRLSHPAAKLIVPQIRYFGNNVLSLLTKIASGYWKVSDTQTGYTAISLSALEKIELYDIYHSYGCPNDILVKLNIANCTIREVPIKPVYAVGEKSKMRILKVVPRISGLLLRDFFRRLWIKYFINSFHPLFLFYFIGIILVLINIPFLIDIIINVLIRQGTVQTGVYMAFVLLAISSFQCIGFGMWMDMQDNESLNK